MKATDDDGDVFIDDIVFVLTADGPFRASVVKELEFLRGDSNTHSNTPLTSAQYKSKYRTLVQL